MQPQEVDLIFTSLSRVVRDHDQIVEVSDLFFETHLVLLSGTRVC